MSTATLPREEEDRGIRLDGENTAVTFAVRWLGMLTVRGRFTQVDGSIQVADGCVDRSTLRVDVVAASLRSGIGLRDRHLRGPQFLDVARFPRITFRSTRIERASGLLIITGTLALRGTEREIRATCPIDFDGASGICAKVRLSASFSVPRLEHGIGVARGIERLNPLLYAISPVVHVKADVLVPASELLPALLPSLGR